MPDPQRCFAQHMQTKAKLLEGQRGSDEGIIAHSVTVTETVTAWNGNGNGNNAYAGAKAPAIVQDPTRQRRE